MRQNRTDWRDKFIIIIGDFNRTIVIIYRKVRLSVKIEKT